MTKQEPMPHIVTLDAVLAPNEHGTYEPIVKKVPTAITGWKFRQLLDYMIKPEADEYNENPLSLAERNLAEKIGEFIALTKREGNVNLQLFVPDAGSGTEGPFTLDQTVGTSTAFTEEEETLEGGDLARYLGLRLRATLYDSGGVE